MVRVIINILMGIGIFLFFLTASIPIMIIATVILNIALAGSPILWNLWVSKIAPAGKSQDYMIIHTAMAGVRGILGPYLAFSLASDFSVGLVGSLSLVLTLVSALGFVLLLKKSSV